MRQFAPKLAARLKSAPRGFVNMTTTSDHLTHERHQIAPLLMSKAQNLANHRDAAAVGAEFECPVNFVIERRPIDLHVEVEWRLYDRKHTMQRGVNR